MKVLSMGWGLQSWTIGAMIVLGEMGQPSEWKIIHSDTGLEMEETYSFAHEMCQIFDAAGIEYITAHHSGARGIVYDYNNDAGARAVSVPAYTTRVGRGAAGTLARRCTGEWKIKPFRRELRKIMRRDSVPLVAGAVEVALGITLDEVERAKDSSVGYIEHIFPLLDMRMSRRDCSAWLRDHGLPEPPKSACYCCPYRSVREWQAMASNGGKDWQQAIAADAAIRDARPGYQSFLHPMRLPLPDAIEAQPLLLDMVDSGCDSGYCFL